MTMSNDNDNAQWASSKTIDTILEHLSTDFNPIPQTYIHITFA